MYAIGNQYRVPRGKRQQPTQEHEHVTEFQPLADRLRGELLRPGASGYDDARRIWNALIDRRPAAIARCRGAADVIATVTFAREHDLLLSVKSGGHHVSGSAVCEGGLMVDLSPMNGVRVDPAARTVRVGAGATWGDVDHETQAFGLAVPGAQDPNVGVAGVTLGGGVGWLSRKYGLTSDNLLAADVVTADGDLVRASETDHPDLFWGLRGGGGNFGIVTEFEFRLHEVGPEIFAGSLVYPFDRVRDVARWYRAFEADAPREVRLLFGSMHMPASASFPEAVRDRRVAILIAFYAGPPTAGQRVLAPLRDRGEPLMDSLRGRRYAAFQRAGESRGRMRTYVRSQYLSALSDRTIETIGSYADRSPSSGATVFVSPRGGAETDPSVDATAYPHRSTAHHLLIETRWDDPSRDEDHIRWTREFHEAIEPFTTGAAAMNFLTHDEPETRRKAAYGANYDRLVDLKTEWDPENRFRLNQNVEPTS
ncbi:MAG: FAD-binding oxidoreductase [Halobacteriota archaeon]